MGILVVSRPINVSVAIPYGDKTYVKKLRQLLIVSNGVGGGNLNGTNTSFRNSPRLSRDLDFLIRERVVIVVHDSRDGFGAFL